MLTITRHGEPTPVVGDRPVIGQKAPDALLTRLDGEQISLQSYFGNGTVLLSVFPDINTSVCDRQTRHFFELAAKLPDTRILNISNNTPAQMASWCAVAGIDATMLSDADRQFADAYGLWMPEYEKLARSVFIIDREGMILYEEVVPEMTQEPDYEQALAILR